MATRYSSSWHLRALNWVAAIATLSCLVASSAARAEFEAQLEAGSSPATIDAEQGESSLLFSRAGRTVTCDVATFSATAESKAESITFTPTYKECSSPSIGGPATITTNGCDYGFNLTADFLDDEHTYRASTDLICPEGKKIEIEIYSTQHNLTTNVVLCKYELAEQKNLNTIALTNEGASEATSKAWLKAHFNLSAIVSKRATGSALICGPENNSEGTLAGEVELKGTASEKATTEIAVTTSDT